MLDALAGHHTCGLQEDDVIGLETKVAAKTLAVFIGFGRRILEIQDVGYQGG